MKRALAAVGIVPVMAAIVSAAPQSAKADDVVVRATAYVVDFVKRFSSVVAEEQYVQESSTLPRVTGSGSNKSFDQPTPIRRVLKEQSRPTILRLKADKDSPMVGRLWIESDTGRLVKTELVVSGNDRVTTTFQFDERFQIAVPIELRESFVVGRTAIEGRATYGQFRQFAVSTEETIK